MTKIIRHTTTSWLAVGINIIAIMRAKCCWFCCGCWDAVRRRDCRCRKTTHRHRPAAVATSPQQQKILYKFCRRNALCDSAFRHHLVGSFLMTATIESRFASIGGGRGNWQIKHQTSKNETKKMWKLVCPSIHIIDTHIFTCTYRTYFQYHSYIARMTNWSMVR